MHQRTAVQYLDPSTYAARLKDERSDAAMEAAMRAWMASPELDIAARFPDDAKVLADRLAAQRAWGEGSLPATAHGRTLPVFYAFSGMDLLTAAGFFPDSPDYTLLAEFSVGDEFCFTRPDCVEQATASAVGWFRHVAERHFRTTNTKTMLELFAPPVGVLPALLLSLRILGHELVRVERVAPIAGAKFEGIVLHTQRRGDATALHQPCTTVRYLGGYLGEEAMPELEALVAPSAPLAMIFKAGPHMITREAWFADAALRWSDLVLQDESGLRPAAFSAPTWAVAPYGRFIGFTGRDYPEDTAELRTLYAAGGGPMPFNIGYYRQAGLSDGDSNEAIAGCWIVAQRTAQRREGSTAAAAAAATTASAAPRLWLLLSSERSGSSWALSMLGRHPDSYFLRRHEPMMAYKEGRIFQAGGARAGETPSASTFLADLARVSDIAATFAPEAAALGCSDKLGRARVAGYKLMWNQGPDVYPDEALAWLKARGAGVIHLVRRATLLQRLSSVQTEHERVAGVRTAAHAHNSSQAQVATMPVHVDRDFVRRTAFSDRTYANASYWAAGLGRDAYYRVFYEDLVRAPDRELARIFSFMGLDPAAEPEQGNTEEFFRLHPESCEGRVANFREAMHMMPPDSGSYRECYCAASPETRQWMKADARARLAVTAPTKHSSEASNSKSAWRHGDSQGNVVSRRQAQL